MTQSLEGILVLDLSQNLAGPFCAQILGDLGADVIKVERPESGDSARHWGPPFWNGEGALFLAGNRNKRSIAIDLARESGREVVRRLAGRADVVVQSFRSGGAEKFGLDHERLRALNPRLIYTSVTAFGTRGPLEHLPGYDPLLQAYGGLMSVTGHAGGPPTRVGTSIVDMGTGMWAAIGILGALRQREATGQGTHITTSLFDTALTWSSYHLIGYLATGHVPGPHGSGLGMIAPYEAFPTADGHVMIAAGTDALFQAACGALSLPDVAADPRFRTNPDRVAHRDELREAIARATRPLATDDALRRLQDAGVPCAPIRSIDQVAEEPQLQANAILADTPHPAIPDLRTVALPVEWDGERAPVRHAPPLLGEHTEEILREFGYTSERIERLEREGAIRRGLREPAGRQ